MFKARKINYKEALQRVTLCLVKQKVTLCRRKGFTLVELVVVITIITVMISIILGNRNGYTEQLSLKSEAYNLALYLRQAQVYGLGVRGSGSPMTFDTSYGVSVNAYVPSANKKFVFFTDKNANNRYDSTVDTTETIDFNNGILIRKLCATDASGSIVAAPNGFGTYNSSHPARFDISFLRPNPTAIITILNKDDVSPTPALYPPIYMVLKSTGSAKVIVKVDPNGQVSVEQTQASCN